jgi:hypothetical protein
MSTAHFTGRFTRGAFDIAVADFGTAVLTCRIAPAASLFADAVILLRDLASLSLIAFETRTPARVATLSVVATHGSALVRLGGHVFVALHLDLMTAAWHRASDGDLAANSSGILILPALGRRQPVAAREREAGLLQLNSAPDWTRLTASPRTGVIAALPGPGAGLKALNDVMQHVGVASTGARMAAMKSLVTWQVASALGRELQEMVRL